MTTDAPTPPPIPETAHERQETGQSGKSLDRQVTTPTVETVVGPVEETRSLLQQLNKEILLDDPASGLGDAEAMDSQNPLLSGVCLFKKKCI